MESLPHEDKSRQVIPEAINADESAVTRASLAYVQRGWNPTPVHSGTKAARLGNWQTTRIDASNVAGQFRADDSIGLVLGDLSGGLTLVDLDSAIALLLADRLLPATDAEEGRASKPRSHRYWSCDPAPGYLSFDSVKTGQKIVELLGNGRQVVVPPSPHPSGEVRGWNRSGEPASATAEELTEAVTRLAVWVELSAIWPENNRHAAAMHLTGGLLRAGWSEGQTLDLVEWLCADTVSNQRELPSIVRDTARKLEEETHVTGWPSLATLTGEHGSIAAILKWLGVTDVDLDDDRPAVRVYAGDLDKLSDQSWAGLGIANDPPTLFRRSNRPVRVERIDDSDTVVIKDLDDVLLRHHLSAAIRYYQLQQDRATKGIRQAPTKVPIDVVRNMLAYAETPLPVLTRLVTVPVFAPNGTLQTEPGYHPDARVYYEPPRGLTLPEVPEKPTPEDVATAKRWLLDELLGEFPFVAEADRAHAVALALLPFVRDLIDGPTPFHLFEAAKQGTGKGLLVRMLTAITTGGDGASATPFSGSEEEVRKMLFSKLLEGNAFILLDNLSGTVQSDALSVALTTSTYTDRRLGVSETPHIPVRCGWVGTANNAVLSADLTRRTVRCRMVAEVEDPHLREFAKSDLIRWSREHRAELVWSALTLVRAWLAEGRPEGRQTLGSYERWAKVVGGILGVVGIPGFLGNLQEFYADANAEGSSWRGFVETWWERHGPEPQSATVLVPVADAVGFAFEKWRDEDKPRELGIRLKGQKDNVYAGFAIRLGTDRKTKANSYRLEPREGQTWEPTAPTPGDEPDGGVLMDLAAFVRRGSAGP